MIFVVVYVLAPVTVAVGIWVLIRTLYFVHEAFLSGADVAPKGTDCE